MTAVIFMEAQRVASPLPILSFRIFLGVVVLNLTPLISLLFAEVELALTGLGAMLWSLEERSIAVARMFLVLLLAK